MPKSKGSEPIVAPSGTRSAARSGAASVQFRMQFAAQHLMAAASFSRRVGEVEAEHKGQSFGAFYDEILWNATASVVLAAACLEAYVNEIAADRSRHFKGHAPEVVDVLWEKSERDQLLDKYDLALLLLGKKPLDRGSTLCQNVHALTYVRNELIHFKAEWMHEPKVHAKVSKTLKGKIKPSPFLDDKDLFPRAWATHSCTSWAVNTARAFGDSIAQHLDQKNPFQQFAVRLQP